ncbi:MAG: FxsA family protein [Actinomycetes bacterium]
MSHPAANHRYGRLVRVVTFLVWPFLEVAVLLAVASWIGWWTTIGLLALSVLAGALVLRRAVRQALGALGPGPRTGSPPIDNAAELAEETVLLLAGLLLVVPGFLSDTLALLLLPPVTRRWVRRALFTWAGRRAVLLVSPPGYRRWTRAGTDDRAGTPRGGVIAGKVVQSHDDPP